jgi:exonuclease VII large subunit
LLAAGWQTLQFKIKDEQNNIFNSFIEALSGNRYKIRNLFSQMETYLRRSLKEYDALEYKVKQVLPKILENQLARFKQQIGLAEKIINQSNPERNLKLGYCLARKDGKIVRRVEDVSIGNKVDIQIFDGTLLSEIKKIHPHLLEKDGGKLPPLEKDGWSK